MLKIEIKPYLDKLGYVNPFRADIMRARQCDNVTMYTSEYYIMLDKLHQDNSADADEWEIKIRNCEVISGLYTRYPLAKDTDSPDNMLGILHAATVLDKPKVAEDILNYGLKHFGWFNVKEERDVDAFLWRQPQLIAACAAAANKLNLFYLPVVVYAALVILYTGLRNIDKRDADARRLCWHLIGIMSPKSWLCRLAAKVWWKKLYQDFPNGLRDVAATYYETGHPFITHWMP